MSQKYVPRFGKNILVIIIIDKFVWFCVQDLNIDIHVKFQVTIYIEFYYKIVFQRDVWIL